MAGRPGPADRAKSIPLLLRLGLCRARKLDFNMMDTSFFVGRVTIVAGRHSRLSGFRRQVFDFMHRNALPATEFFRIPPGRVIELGGQVAM